MQTSDQSLEIILTKLGFVLAATKVHEQEGTFVENWPIINQSYDCNYLREILPEGTLEQRAARKYITLIANKGNLEKKSQLQAQELVAEVKKYKLG